MVKEYDLKRVLLFVLLFPFLIPAFILFFIIIPYDELFYDQFIEEWFGEVHEEKY